MAGKGLNPADDARAVTTKPPYVANSDVVQKWFGDCSTPTSDDGTRFLARDANMLLYNMRYAATALGLPDDDGEDFLYRLLVGAVWITADVTYTVGSDGGDDFADLNEAMAFLRTRLIADNATVTLSLRAEVHSYSDDVIISHPTGHRIHIIGAAMTGADPVAGDFTVTGSGTGARASDGAANLSMLQGKFNTELHFTNSKGLIIRDYGLGLIDDVLVRGDGSSSYGFKIEKAMVTAGNLAVYGFGDDNIYGREAHLLVIDTLVTCGGVKDGIEFTQSVLRPVDYSDTEELLAFGNGGQGIEMSESTSTVAAIASRGNASDGIFIRTGFLAAVTSFLASDNGQCGLNADDAAIVYLPDSAATVEDNASAGCLARRTAFVSARGVLADNNQYGIQAYQGGVVDALNATATNNSSIGVYSAEGSFITGSGVTSSSNGTNYSPAVNTVGNANSYTSA